MKKYAYVGCRTTKERNARGKGIYVYEIEENNWKLIQILENQINPSYLCIDEKQNFLYSVHGDFSEVSSYKIDENGKITHINTVQTHGTNPVHLSLDKTGKLLFVANLQTGGISVIPINENGSLGFIKQLAFISGNGGPGYISHPHQVAQDKTGEWLVVPSQGRLQGVGKITVFKIDSENSKIVETSLIKARDNAEPRHCAFHSNNKFCYCLNEKDSTVTLYYFDNTKGVLESIQILSTLPEDFTSNGWGSAIEIDKKGNFLYLSNRKHDSITVFKLNQENGKMSYLQNIKTRGEQPRFITLNPTGTQLIVANELTDNICCFYIKENGTLEYNGIEIKVESPVCVVFKN